MNIPSSTLLVDDSHGLKFTESPRWRDGKWWFLDIHSQAIKTVDLTGHLQTVLDLPFKPNGFGFRRDGSVMVGDALGRKIHRWDGSTLAQVADLSGMTVFCLSDGIVDSQDRMYVGDIGYNFFDPANQPVDTCVITCIEADGRARVVAEGLSFPNGMIVTPDGRTLIVAETTGHRLTAFDVRADGALVNRRVYAQLAEDVQPDGIALDAEGGVWIANPDGLTNTTHVPVLALGDPDMTRLIDLTATLDPANRAKLPPPMAGAAKVVAPAIEYLHPAEQKGRDEFCLYLGCRHEDLPDGEGWGAEVLTDMSSHCGTHVDAPLHSGSRTGGERARTITDIALEELYRPGLVLDVRPWARPGEVITIAMLDAALAATGRRINAGDAVLMRTGQERYTMTDPEFYMQPGMSRAGTLHLTRQGATILGTDAVGWDLPFGVMARKFRETGDNTLLWDGHRAIVEKEAFIVQQMTNLGALPLAGFVVGFFPIKLAGCSAAPARVVAFVD